MLTKLVIVLDSREREALQIMAEREMRGLKDQVRFLLREEAKRRGILSTDDSGEFLPVVRPNDITEEVHNG